MKRMMSACFLSLAAVCCATTVLAQSWSSGSCRGLQEDPEEWNIGGVLAYSGAIESWEISGDVKTEGGQWGCRFTNGQYTNTVNTLNDVRDYSKHLWTHQGGPAGTSTMNVRVDVTPGASGTASAMQNEEWWWKPNVKIFQEAPKIYMMDMGTGSWGEPVSGYNIYSLPVDAGDPDGAQHSFTGYYQTPNLENTPSTPIGSSGVGGHEGHEFAKMQLPLYGERWLKIEFHFEVDASGDIDNATLQDWREYLAGNLESYVDSSSPSEPPIGWN